MLPRVATSHRSASRAPIGVDRTFAALADPTRRGVVELLKDGPRRAGELAAAFSMSPPAMSRHLRVLRRTGLVEEDELEDDARVRVYRLRHEPFSALRGWVERVEAFWVDQLDAFKAHAEAVSSKRRATPLVEPRAKRAPTRKGRRR